MIMYGRYYSIPCADSKGILHPVSLQFTFTFFLNIPSFPHSFIFFEYRLLTPGRSDNSFNSKEVEHLRNLNYVNTLYSIIR